MTSILCEHCAAACCRYLALPIEKPSNARDYDDIRWYLMHEGISIFVEDGDWYIQIQTRCKNLGEDNRCMVYEERPEICAEFQPVGCDYTSSTHGYELHFTHATQIEDYYAQKTGKRLALDHVRGVRPSLKAGRAGNAKGRKNGASIPLRVR